MRTVLEISRPGLINSVPNLSIKEDVTSSKRVLINSFDILGRNALENESLVIEIYDNGDVTKKISIK